MNEYKLHIELDWKKFGLTEWAKSCKFADYSGDSWQEAVAKAEADYGDDYIVYLISQIPDFTSCSK